MFHGKIQSIYKEWSRRLTQSIKQPCSEVTPSIRSGINGLNYCSAADFEDELLFRDTIRVPLRLQLQARLCLSDQRQQNNQRDHASDLIRCAQHVARHAFEVPVGDSDHSETSDYGC